MRGTEEKRGETMKKALEVSSVIALAAAGVALGLWLATGDGPGSLAPRVALAETPPAAGGKLLEVAPEGMLVPVWITKVTVGGKFLLAPDAMNPSWLPNQIIPRQRFSASDDWLKDMTIYVENRTDKPVAWLSIALQFPETGNGRTQPTWIYRIQRGRIPAVDASNVSARSGKPLYFGPDATPLELQPGQVLAIHVGDYIDKIKAYVETAMPLTFVTNCYIYFDACLLDDGERWVGGVFSAPDPANPGKWIYQRHHYFPGDMHKYLPNVVTRRGQPPNPAGKAQP
jgi:hypothetical protein